MNHSERLTQERRARLAAEHLLAKKHAELSEANKKLGMHAMALTRRIGETQAEVDNVRNENEQFRSDLCEANEKIQIAERRLWLSIQTIRDGFAFFDADSRLITANDAYIDFFDGLEEIQPGVDYTRILDLLIEEGLVNPGDLSPGDWHTMMLERWYSPSPKPITVQFWNGMYMRMFDQRGHGGDVVSLSHNITSSVRNELELTAARHKAEAANRAKSAFLANMSHEIRTPMNGVVGMAELLAETALNDEQKLYTETIRNSGEALLVIINDVLDYSKIEADKLVLHPEPFDLERCIHEVVMLLQPPARDKGLDLIVDYDMFLPTSFVGDPGRVRQILTNLMGNAVKFTLEGHVLIRVTGVGPDAEGRHAVHVAVEDTGIGIPKDKKDDVFGEFNQVENERSRQFEGTGLGLAITKRLIHLMNGTMWLDSEVGVGSCFGFRVPLPPAQEQTADAEPKEDLPLDRILCVSALPEILTVLRKHVKIHGIETVDCGRAEDALDRMDDRVDLIVIDMDLIDQKGLDLILALRQAGWSDTPVFILVTPPFTDRTSPAMAEVSAVLEKPLRRGDLAARLRDITGVTETVPRVTSAPEPSPEPVNEVPTTPEPETKERQMRVLVAEDNKTNQLVLRKMVKDQNLNLKFANNGEEAVAAYPEFEPDLIFMDISMPRMDGKTATGEIRKIEASTGHRTPIVALTAHAMSGDEESILAAGLDFYLTKPLRKPEILAKIEEFRPDSASDNHPAADAVSG
ncbi:MAG: response regulator [Paracoccaceae bacterium]